MSEEKARVAVVTGAGKGIGLGLCATLLKEGFQVVLTARTEAAVGKGLAALGETARLDGRALDVTNPISINLFYNWLFLKHGRIDVLVNNAARVYYDNNFVPYPGFADVEPEVILEAFQNNALSAYRMMKWALPAMNRQNYGRVINVSSRMASLALMGGNGAAYRVSKTALNAMMVLASKAAEGNVKVNAIDPGHVRTDMGGPRATRTIEQGVASIMWAVRLPEDGPNGGFFCDGEPVPW